MDMDANASSHGRQSWYTVKIHEVLVQSYDAHLQLQIAQGNGGSRPNTPARLETPEPGSTGIWGAL